MAAHCTDDISACIMKHLEPFLAAADNTTDLLQDVMAGAIKAADRLYSMSEDARDALQKAAKVMKDEVGRAVEGTCEGLTKVMEGLSEATSKPRVNELDKYSFKRCSFTYMAALSSQLPAAHQSALARARA